MGLAPCFEFTIDLIFWTNLFIVGWVWWVGWVGLAGGTSIWIIETMAHFEVVVLTSILVCFQHIFSIVAFWEFTVTCISWTCIAFSIFDTFVEKSFDFLWFKLGWFEVTAGAAGTSLFAFITAFSTLAWWATAWTTAHTGWFLAWFVIFSAAWARPRSFATATWSTALGWFWDTWWKHFCNTCWKFI